MIQDNEDFCTEFELVCNSHSISEADNFSPEALENTYLDMEIALPRDSNGPEFTKVTKRLHNKEGLPIRTANDNPILNSCLCEVKYADSYKVALTANSLAENIFAKVGNEGNRFVLLDIIANHRVDSSILKEDNRFITSSNGSRRR